MHAIMSALRFPPMPTNCAKLSCTLSTFAAHPCLAGPMTLPPTASSSSIISLSTFLSTLSTSLFASTPSLPSYTCINTRLAFSFCPLLARYRGVSGMKNNKQNCTNAGNAPSPTIHRQPWSFVENNQPTIYATTCPPVINRLEIVTIRPLHGPGDSSPIYSGTTKLALPTAAPTTPLPAIMPHTLPVQACHSAPTTKRMSAVSMMVLRPSASARTPDSGETRSAQKEVAEVMRDLSRVVRGREERSELMETRVEDMTPVLQVPDQHYVLDSINHGPDSVVNWRNRDGYTYSYPNNNPDTPAQKVSTQINLPGLTSLLSSTSKSSPSSS
jgi:hypothetical protein